MKTESCVYFILHRTEYSYTELCAYKDGRITIRQTNGDLVICEIPLCTADKYEVDHIQAKLDKLKDFINPT